MDTDRRRRAVSVAGGGHRGVPPAGVRGEAAAQARAPAHWPQPGRVQIRFDGHPPHQRWRVTSDNSRC